MGKPLAYDLILRAMELSHKPVAVIAGLVPATPIIRHGGASQTRKALCLIIGVAGTSPAMTI
jgi:hypothetical protein